MILYMLEWINTFSKVAGYKINIKIKVSLLNTKINETSVNKLIPFTTASKTTKYLGIHLTNNVKDLRKKKIL